MSALAGVNWGFASVNDSSLVFKPTADSKDAIFSVSKDTISSVTNTRTDVTISIKEPEKMPTFFCREVKLTAAPESHGIPSGQGAGQYLAEQLRQGRRGGDGAGGAVGGMVASEAAARATGKVLCGEFEGVAIAQPSGHYNISVYTNQLVLHDTAKGHFYVVPVANVVQMFLLAVPNVEARYFVVALSTPLQVGSTQHKNMVFSFPDNQVMTEEEPWRAALTTEAEITKHLPDNANQLLKPTMSGPVFQIVASVFKAVCKVSLIGAHTEYVARSTGTCALGGCQFKSNSGSLYVLKKYLLFLHRPATVIPYETINGPVELEMFDSFASMTLQVPRKTGSGYEKMTFGTIPKNEVQLLAAYLRTRGLKVDHGQGGNDDDDDDDESDDEDYESNESDDDDDDDNDSDDSDAPKKRKEKKSKSDKKIKKEKKSKKEKKHKKDKKRERE